MYKLKGQSLNMGTNQSLKIAGTIHIALCAHWLYYGLYYKKSLKPQF